jgi:hypothetical protein
MTHPHVPRNQLDVAQASKIAQAITAITSFESEDNAVDRLLSVLQEQPLVSAAALWKIKRESRTLCAKGRTLGAFDPDPMDPNFATAFVCPYQDSIISQIIDSLAFSNGQPCQIHDIHLYNDDIFFRDFIAHSAISLKRGIILPLKSYLRTSEQNPSFFLTIYISEESENTHINDALLHAIANKTSSTLSTQLERNQNRITNFIKDTTIRSPKLREILSAFMHQIIPSYFSFVHSILLWRWPGSQKYDCVYSSKGNQLEFTRAQLFTITQLCVDRGEEARAVFDASVFIDCCPELRFVETAIIAPVRNRVRGDAPHGFIILFDKLSPFARRINPDSTIIDRFDWEDELMGTSKNGLSFRART